MQQFSDDALCQRLDDGDLLRAETGKPAECAPHFRITDGFSVGSQICDGGNNLPGAPPFHELFSVSRQHRFGAIGVCHKTQPVFCGERFQLVDVNNRDAGKCARG